MVITLNNSPYPEEQLISWDCNHNCSAKGDAEITFSVHIHGNQCPFCEHTFIRIPGGETDEYDTQAAKVKKNKRPEKRVRN